MLGVFSPVKAAVSTQIRLHNLSLFRQVDCVTMEFHVSPRGLGYGVLFIDSGQAIGDVPLEAALLLTSHVNGSFSRWHVTPSHGGLQGSNSCLYITAKTAPTVG